MKKALLHLANFSERAVRNLAQAIVPAINLADRLLAPQPKTSLQRISMEHFNVRPTCLARVETRRYR